MVVELGYEQCKLTMSPTSRRPRRQPPQNSSGQRSVDDQRTQLYSSGNLAVKHTPMWLAEAHDEQIHGLKGDVNLNPGAPLHGELRQLPYSIQILI